MINLDVMGNPPLGPAARKTLETHFNRNSPPPLHPGGESVRPLVDRARDQVAALIGASGSNLIFTASASESLNLAVKGLAWAAPGPGTILISAVEHHAVVHAARFLERQGYRVKTVPVDSRGRVDLTELKRGLAEGPILAAIQAASNEVGTLQDLAAIGDLCRAAEVPLVVDAAVAGGRTGLRMGEFHPTAVALAAHQWGGPRGVGALWVKPDTRLVPLVHGGIQENGLRAGTEFLPGMLAAGAAAEERGAALEAGLGAELTRAAHTLRAALEDHLPEVRFTGDPRERLPGHLSCVTPVEGEALVLGLALQGVLVSTGSTCSQAGIPSHVLTALGLSPRDARGSLVFSMDESATDAELAHAAVVTAREIARLQSLAPAEDTGPP